MFALRVRSGLHGGRRAVPGVRTGGAPLGHRPRRSRGLPTYLGAVDRDRLAALADLLPDVRGLLRVLPLLQADVRLVERQRVSTARVRLADAEGGRAAPGGVRDAVARRSPAPLR